MPEASDDLRRFQLLSRIEGEMTDGTREGFEQVERGGRTAESEGGEGGERESEGGQGELVAGAKRGGRAEEGERGDGEEEEGAREVGGTEAVDRVQGERGERGEERVKQVQEIVWDAGALEGEGGEEGRRGGREGDGRGDEDRVEETGELFGDLELFQSMPPQCARHALPRRCSPVDAPIRPVPIEAHEILLLQHVEQRLPRRFERLQVVLTLARRPHRNSLNGRTHHRQLHEALGAVNSVHGQLDQGDRGGGLMADRQREEPQAAFRQGGRDVEKGGRRVVPLAGDGGESGEGAGAGPAGEESRGELEDETERLEGERGGVALVRLC